MDRFPSGTVLLNAADILRRAHIDLGMTVGDFGCGGTGLFTLEAARLVGDQGKVYAIDILKSALSSVVSKARLSGLINVHPVWSNLEMYGATRAIRDGSVDLSVVVNTLHQSQKPESILKEVARMTSRNGRVLVVDWMTGRASFGPSEKNLVLPERVRPIAEQLGLHEEASFEAGPYHYGLLLTKQPAAGKD
jgi:ubiquinone/menaquinone biosynthesis C-methylase UbiE